jgi:serine O-acetyltransferase
MGAKYEHTWSIFVGAERRVGPVPFVLTRGPLKYDGDTIKAWVGDSQWRAFRADLAHFRKHGYSGWGSGGFWALEIHRLQKVVRRTQPRWLWMPIRLTLGLVDKLFTMVTHTHIHPDAQIGPGLFIPHVGLRVHGNTKIGADCTIHQVCTIGAGPRSGGATIGDHVIIGCNSCIIGAVIIGDGAIIAPNSLVISDVPVSATAMGRRSLDVVECHLAELAWASTVHRASGHRRFQSWRDMGRACPWTCH